MTNQLYLGSTLLVSDTDVGGGGGAAATGTTADPILLAPCQWFLVISSRTDTFLAYTYDAGVAGVGATVTANANGLLSALVASAAGVLEDGKVSGLLASVSDPQVGDRVLFMDNWNGTYQSVYIITSVGSLGTPWVLTQATDTDDVTDSTLNFRVDLAGTVYWAHTAKFDINSDFGAVTQNYPWAVGPSGGRADGLGSAALGHTSVALGWGASAMAADAQAFGSSAYAASSGSTAVGTNAVATEANTTVIGSHTAGAVVIQGIRTTATDSFTLAKIDAGKHIPCNKATPMTVTIPLNATVAFDIGTTIRVRQVGAGQVTVALPGGTLTYYLGPKTAGVGAVIEVEKIGTDAWHVSGNTAA